MTILCVEVDGVFNSESNLKARKHCDKGSD